jgi:uncharacterized protein YecE (DUF72 family)
LREDAIEALLTAGRLEAVLFQFPDTFHYEDDARRYLDKVLTYYKEVPLAVEFRGAEWINDRVINTLREPPGSTGYAGFGRLAPNHRHRDREDGLYPAPWTQCQNLVRF